MFYALYSKDDEYIAGFKTFKEIGEYLGTGRFSVLTLCGHTPEKKGSEIRVLVEEGDESYYQCSQCIHQYSSQKLRNRYGRNLGVRCKLFKFWEETIEKENPKGEEGNKI